MALAIEELGVRGDGVATQGGRRVYVAGALPGERVLARPSKVETAGLRASLQEVSSPSPDRRQPPCPHFGPCGGCGLQHLSEDRYRDWKRTLLVTALRQRGFAAAEQLVGPLHCVPAGSRRRVEWAAMRTRGGLSLGFHERGGRRIVDQVRCLLLTPALQDLLQPLRRLLDEVLPTGAGGDIHATETDSGIDLLLRLPQEPGLRERERLAAFAQDHDLARLSLRQESGGIEPLAQRRLATVTFATLAVSLPPGQFLQPSREGEALLRERVSGALGTAAGPIADLFSGCGTFSLPLASAGNRVVAVESDAAALSALEQAARSAGFAERIDCRQRDLMRQPLAGKDLSEFSALVFDPPRPGASAQCQALADTGPPIIIGVSCNPASFARDARLLVEGGYRLEWAAPIDQFPWSHHLELVARFVR